MKFLKYLSAVFFASTLLVSCNSEDLSYDIDYTAIHPLGGEYNITLYKNGVKLATTYTIIGNTTDNSATKCWVRIGAYNATSIYVINGKVDCNVKDLTFSGANIENLAGNVATSTAKFSLTGGKVTLKDTVDATGITTDKIYYTYTSTKDPGVTYTVKGYRRTGW